MMESVNTQTVSAFVLGILASIIASLILIPFAIRSRAPKILITGGGSGKFDSDDPGLDLMGSTISVMNDPHFLGVKVNRETANLTRAYFIDPKWKDSVGGRLKWQVAGGGKSYEMTLAPGETANLNVFAKERYGETFFVVDTYGKDEKVKVSRSIVKEDAKELQLFIYDKLERLYKFDVVARNRDQSVDVRTRPHGNKLRRIFLGRQ